jgi:hypothetical protein
MGEVWRSDGRVLFWMVGIGVGAFVFDEILGALGKSQYKTPLNVAAFFTCLALAVSRIGPVLDAMTKLLGLE